MVCKSCGAENEEGSKFCVQCGSRLEETAPAEDKKEEAAVNTETEDTPAAETDSEDKFEGHAGSHETDGESCGCEYCKEEAASEEPGTIGDKAANKGPAIAAAEPSKESYGYSTDNAVGAGKTNDAPVNDATQDEHETEKKKKGISKPQQLLIGAGVLIVAVIALVVTLVSTHKPTIKLNDYLTITTKGYDGYGKAEAVIDWDAIEKDYGSSLKLTKAAKNSGLSIEPMEGLKEDVGGYLDVKENLSNGDTITFSWSVASYATDTVKCKLEYEDVTQTVEGLADITTFDVFEDVSVEFSGTAPLGTATLTYTGTDFDENQFSCDKKNELRNGDTVEVTLNVDADSYAEANGKVPEAFSKTYTVDGLDEYIDSFKDIPEETAEALKQNSEDIAVSKVASSRLGSFAEGPEYIGYVLLSPKETGATRYSNVLYVVYKGKVNDGTANFSRTLYFPVKYTNVLITGDGDVSWDEDVTVPYDYEAVLYNDLGYDDPYKCYTDVVEAKKDLWNVECGDGFDAYAEYENIDSLEDISADCKAAMEEDAKSKIENEIATDYDYANSGRLECGTLNLVGEYLLTAKNTDSYLRNNNRCIVVYSMAVTSTKGDFDPVTVYFPVAYDGIANLPDGDYLIILASGILGQSYFPDGYCSNTAGYIDGTEMFTKTVAAKKGDCTYVMSDALKVFGE